MIPIIQQDYFKYKQMFHGNASKGASYLESLLQVDGIAEQLVKNHGAVSAIFTDFKKNNLTRKCYDVLKRSPYFEEAAFAYLAGAGLTEHENFTNLFKDAPNAVEVFQHRHGRPLIYENNEVFIRALKTPAISERLRSADCADIIIEDRAYLDHLTEHFQRGEFINLVTSLSTFFTTIKGKVTPWSPSESYSSYAVNTEWAICADELGAVLVPGYVSVTGTYYYPAVFKYIIASETWSLLHCGSTNVKQTDTKNYSRNAYGIAYDKKNDHVYMFYRIQSTSTDTYVDIVKGSTGAVVLSEVKVSSVGAASTAEPCFCCFDDKNGLAKFAWRAGAYNDNTTAGWVQGCSVNVKGSVWSGNAATAVGTLRSFKAGLNLSSWKYRNPRLGAAVIGQYIGTPEDNSSARCIMVMSIHSVGQKLEARSCELFRSTYTDFTSSAPSTTALTDSGILALNYRSDKWSSNTSANYLALLALSADNIGKHDVIETDNTFSFRIYDPFGVMVVERTVSSNKEYMVYARASNGSIKLIADDSFDAAQNAVLLPGLSDQYRLEASGTSMLRLYKIYE